MIYNNDGKRGKMVIKVKPKYIYEALQYDGENIDEVKGMFAKKGLK